MFSNMDLGAKLCNTTITKLPPELVQTLCEYLGDVDIVNICTAIPSWEWILFLRTQHSYLNKWKWIDKRVCTTLYSDPQAVCSAKISEAAKLHFEQMKVDLQFPSIRALRSTFERVNCILFTSILTIQRSLSYFVRPLRVRSNLFLQIVNSSRPTSVYVEAVHFLPPYSAFGSRSTPKSIEIIYSEYKKRLQRRVRTLLTFDCVLYVIELSMLRKYGPMIRTELQDIVTNLSSEQTLGVVIINDVERKEESGMDFFMDCIQKFCFVSDSPFLTTQINWRMWCIQDRANYITNRKCIFKWVCQDVIWRRMQGTTP
uniref:F-box domain-containing protein n=1 Tax=Echinococcus canadensis TaxID=519352 RepID=A0A915EXC2_9CEST